MIGLVAHGVGNVASVGHALDRLGQRWRYVRHPVELRRVDAVIVPGVGAAGAALSELRLRGMDSALVAFISEGRPFLGICLGLQMLFSASQEGSVPGLAVLEGEVRRLPETEKVPHVGWNTIEVLPTSSLLAGMDGWAFYFSHSFAALPAHAAVVTATTRHGPPFVSAVEQGLLFGVQFHPERSGPAGARLLARFVQLGRAA